jgi:hypothetical protein
MPSPAYPFTTRLPSREVANPVRVGGENHGSRDASGSLLATTSRIEVPLNCKGHWQCRSVRRPELPKWDVSLRVIGRMDAQVPGVGAPAVPRAIPETMSAAHVLRDSRRHIAVRVSAQGAWPTECLTFVMAKVLAGFWTLQRAGNKESPRDWKSWRIGRELLRDAGERRERRVFRRLQTSKTGRYRRDPKTRLTCPLAPIPIGALINEVQKHLGDLGGHLGWAASRIPFVPGIGQVPLHCTEK